VLGDPARAAEAAALAAAVLAGRALAGPPGAGSGGPPPVRVTVPVGRRHGAVGAVVRALDDAGIEVDDLVLRARRPSTRPTCGSPATSRPGCRRERPDGARGPPAAAAALGGGRRADRRRPRRRPLAAPAGRAAGGPAVPGPAAGHVRVPAGGRHGRPRGRGLPGLPLPPGCSPWPWSSGWRPR
jgi:hypothetical protein